MGLSVVETLVTIKADENETLTRKRTMTTAANLYDSLFNGKSSPMSEELQAEYDAATERAESNVASMSEDEKIAEFNRIMGRTMMTRFFVMNNGRKAVQYADKAAAIAHAKAVGGEVKTMQFEPQYTKAVGVRGGQERVREFGTRHAECSRKQAIADGVKWFEVR